MMSKIFVKLIILSYALFSPYMWALSGNDIIQKINDNFNSINDFSANFIQLDKWELSESIDKTQGLIYYQKPDQFKIVANNSWIIINKNTVWRYSKENNQLLIEKRKEDMLLPSDLFFKFMNEYKLLDYHKNKDGGYKLLLSTEPGKEKFINRIQVWCDSDFMVYKSLLVDIDGNEKEIRVEDVKTNVQLKASIFNTEPPKGAEVVDLR